MNEFGTATEMAMEQDSKAGEKLNIIADLKDEVSTVFSSEECLNTNSRGNPACRSVCGDNVECSQIEEVHVRGTRGSRYDLESCIRRETTQTAKA